MSSRFAFMSPGALRAVSLRDGAWARGSPWDREGRGAGHGSAVVASLCRGFGRLHSAHPSQGQTREAVVALGVLRVSPVAL